jgi:hypothetical protein
MIKFLFKTGVYLFYWKKFKSQIISIIASIIIIWLIFGIYEDLIRIFEIKEVSTLLYLLFAKWVIIGFIVLYSILLIKSIKKSDTDEIFRNEETILPKKSQEILDKKDILTTTDIILKKYINNKDL